MSVESNPGLNRFCFTVLFDWSRKLAPPSQPIRCKLKPIAPWSLAFSRATGRLHAFTSSCHWLPLIISFTLIGLCDYFGFGFRHSIEKRSKVVLTFESVDKILRCDHSNETSLPVLSNGAICFQNIIKQNLGISVEFCPWPLLALKGLKGLYNKDIAVLGQFCVIT